MLKNIVATAFILLAFFSCQWGNRYPGFTKTRTGIYYKLLAIGDTVAPPVAGDYVTANLSYSTVKDSVFFNGARTFQLTNPDFKGSVDECFLMLSNGDSASFIIDAKKFFTQTLQSKLPSFIQPGDPIKISIKINEIRTAAQYQQDKEEFLKWIEDFGEYEKTVLRNFIEKEKIDVEPAESGMYFISLRPGVGKPVEIGDVVTVQYEGRFLNGHFFDSTVKSNQPFEFVYGSEMQVIPGIESAIGRMREGEKALIILPSELAWGEKGSSTGIIPPFTSVIYEIELIKAVPRGQEEPTGEE